MGYEGFSTPFKQPRMHPVWGNRGEFLFLAILLPSLILIKASRQKNEDGIRAALGNANNRYAHYATVNPTDL